MISNNNNNKRKKRLRIGAYLVYIVHVLIAFQQSIRQGLYHPIKFIVDPF